VARKPSTRCIILTSRRQLRGIDLYRRAIYEADDGEALSCLAVLKNHMIIMPDATWTRRSTPHGAPRLAPPRTLHGNSVAVPVARTTANRLISLWHRIRSLTSTWHRSEAEMGPLLTKQQLDKVRAIDAGVAGCKIARRRSWPRCRATRRLLCSIMSPPNMKIWKRF
jgi:hypothetical protein